MTAPLGFDHIGLMCSDIDRSVAFYHRALGLTLRGRGVSTVQAADTAGEQFAWADIGLPDGRIIELIRFLDRDVPPPGGGHFGLAVTDLAETLAELAAIDIHPTAPSRTLTETGDWFGATIAFVTDPDGHCIELVQRVP